MEKSKSVLITGGTGLIGRELIKGFLARGDAVFFTSRTQEKIRDVEENFKGARGIQFDFSKATVEDFVSVLKDQKISGFDYVIHAYRDTQNLQMNVKAVPSQEQWMAEYKAAVITPVELTIELSEMGLKGAVMISSIYGITTTNMNLYEGNLQKTAIHYNLAKAAQNHAARELAVRLAPKNIRVNVIAYGGVKGRASHEFEKKYESLCPYKGMLEPENVAGSVLFLCSQASEHITGQVLSVDGGWGIW